MNQFFIDNKIAQKNEEIVQKLYINFGMINIEPNFDYRYDFKGILNNKELKIECKEDFLCEKTNNVAVEFSCRNKPSGILTSEADFYIYTVHTKTGIIILKIKSESLKDAILKKLYFTIVNGGDKGSNSLNYLFKLEKFLEFGEILSKV